MQGIKRKFRNPGFIFTFAAIIILLPSCQTIHQALMHKTQPQDDEIEVAYIEDFFPSEKQDIYSHAAKTRIELRLTAEEDLCLADARNTLIYTDFELAGIRDIGGEELKLEDSIGGPLVGVKDDVIVAEELEDVTGEYKEKFDPAKIAGKIMLDVTMEDMSCFVMPVEGKVNSKFGWRRGRVHAGIDLDLETGDHVQAMLDGIVAEAKYSGGYGNLVILKHDNGLETYYAHLSKIKVEPGQKVEAGEVIGLGGSTGRSTGPHLHFEIRYLGAALDPSYIIDFENQQLRNTEVALEKSTFKVINEKASTQYYTVRKGDTLSKIAVKHGTSVNQICKLNGISSKKIIKPGMKLRVR